MNTSKLGDWIAIATNIAVLAGIVALGYEIGQNTKHLRAQASYNMLLNRAEPRAELLSNPELAEFWIRVEVGDSLTAADMMRIRASAEHTILKWHWEYGQYVDGNLSLSELPVSAYRAAYRGDYGVSLIGIPEAWPLIKDGLRPDFVDWMEANVVGQ